MNPLSYRAELMNSVNQVQPESASAAAYADLTLQPEWRKALNKDWVGLQNSPDAALEHSLSGAELAIQLCAADSNIALAQLKGAVNNWQKPLRKSALRKQLLGHVGSAPFFQDKAVSERSIVCDDSYYHSPKATIKLNKAISEMAAGIPDSTPAAKYLTAVESIISQHGAPVDHITLATIFHRLGRFDYTCTDSDTSSVLLEKHAERIARLENINGQAIGNILHGIHNFHTVPPKLLDVLADTIGRSEAVLNAQNINLALHGLRNLHTVPDSLLEALADKIEGCDEQFISHDIGAALYGLQNMVHAPKRLISALTYKIHESVEPLAGKSVGDALYGLQSLNPVPEELLGVLMGKIESGLASDLTAGDIVGGLVGMYKHVLASSTALYLAESFFEKLEENSLWNDTGEDFKYILMMRQLYALYGRKVPSELALAYDIAARKQEIFSHEQEIARLVAAATGYHVETGVLIDGFECDLLITGGTSNKHSMVWVELDGSHHDFPTKQRHDRLKVEYLTEKLEFPEPLRVSSSQPRKVVARTIIRLLNANNMVPALS